MSTLCPTLPFAFQIFFWFPCWVPEEVGFTTQRLPMYLVPSNSQVLRLGLKRGVNFGGVGSEPLRAEADRSLWVPDNYVFASFPRTIRFLKEKQQQTRGRLPQLDARDSDSKLASRPGGLPHGEEPGAGVHQRTGGGRGRVGLRLCGAVQPVHHHQKRPRL